MFSLSRQSIRSDASRFGRWNHQSSLSVIDRARLQMVDMSLFGETHSGWRLWCHPHAHPQTRTHTHTHTHTHPQSWALSLTSISCSVRVSLFLSLQIRLFSLSLFFIFLFSSDHRHFFSTVTLLPHYNSNNFCVSLPLSQLLTNTVKKKKILKNLSLPYRCTRTCRKTVFQTSRAVCRVCPSPLQVRLLPAQSRLWALCVCSD